MNSISIPEATEPLDEPVASDKEMLYRLVAAESNRRDDFSVNLAAGTSNEIT